MSAIKLSFTFVLLIVAANGQVNPPPTRSPQEFWTLFAQLLTADALKFLANADIFPNPADMMPPAVPANPNPPTAPQPSTTTIFIRGRPFTIPPASDKDAADLANALANINAPAAVSSNSVAPSQPSAASAPFDPISEIWNVFLELYGSPQVKPMPMPQQPSQWPIIVGPQPQSPQKPTPAPCSTTPATLQQLRTWKKSELSLLMIATKRRVPKAAQKNQMKLTSLCHVNVLVIDIK
ncbi:hypothetical protein PVAND_004775 [Polypedilum vanderplanki]|uniref:Uncharacterized protein n=1 Tax=Polypedilum vanderplanki TaxID=319348 RepID=A0A9J6BZ42_POLVA|nr:hypothetical protein PVAND_004775 [Polypedilum vanderplanki]